MAGGLAKGLTIVALALLLPAVLLAQGAPGGGPRQGGPLEVGVMALRRAEVPVTATLPGRAVAVQQASIRPQVEGQVTAITYRPGTEVAAGTVLFRLDDQTPAAALAAQEVAVASAAAALEGAGATVERYRRLQGSGVSRAELQSAQVALASARAALSAAEAQRDLDRLALDRTEIRSPIDGVADLASVSVGDIVGTQSAPLTTVTDLDPIHVDVSESRANILRNRAREAEGSLDRVRGPSAELILETGQVYAGGGRMVTPGTAVSPTTGTVPFRLEFPNPDRLILPGQFVRVKLTIGRVDALLVPQRATRRAASGALSAFVIRDGRAAQVTLTEQGSHENAWIVTDGVNEGDLLALDGLSNLRDGAEVRTVPVTIDVEGVVRPAAPEGADAAAGSPEAEPGPAGTAPAAPAATPGNTAQSTDAPTATPADGPAPANAPAPANGPDASGTAPTDAPEPGAAPAASPAPADAPAAPSTAPLDEPGASPAPADEPTSTSPAPANASGAAPPAQSDEPGAPPTRADESGASPAPADTAASPGPRPIPSANAAPPPRPSRAP